MTRSAPAPSAPLQIGRAYAARAGSIMRFNMGDTAHAQLHWQSKTTSGSGGFGAAQWETLGVQGGGGEEGGRLSKGPRGSYEKRFCASLGSPRIFT